MSVLSTTIVQAPSLPDWPGVPAMPVFDKVELGMLLKVSEPQFLLLSNGEN